MKSTTKYSPSTRSRYAYQAILDRIEDLNYEHARMVQERLQRHLDTVSLDAAYRATVAAATPPAAHRSTYRQEYTRCRQGGCATCNGGPGHGPYWYAYWG